MVKKHRHGSHVHPECLRRKGNHHSAKLTEGDVSEIRRRYVLRKPGGPRKGEVHVSQMALAREYGVSVSALNSVLLGRTWKGV
jgi:hypothetical protein